VLRAVAARCHQLRLKKMKNALNTGAAWAS